MKKISSRLRELRGKTTQEEFSKKFGVSQVAYGRWELGKREPDLDTIEKICKTESVSADWLLGLTDSRDGGGAATATNGSAAATGNARATVSTACASRDAEVSRLLSLVESQQRVIEALSSRKQ